MKIQDIIEAHGNSKIYDKCWTGYKKVPGKKRGEKSSCEKIGEGLNEMDKSAPQPGRDGKVSHSTYGSRDKKGSDYFKGKEAPGKPITKKEMEKYALDILKKQGVAEDSLNEFAPGSSGGESGRWYTDDQMTDLVGDGWYEDMDVSGNISKQQMIQQAQAWLDDQGYSVQVLNAKLNDDDMDWFIQGSFHNPNFAKKGVAEGNPIDTDWYRKQQERQTKAKQRQQGVAEGSSESVSFREMINVVDEHYPKYYAELSGSDISDEQFKQEIISTYNEITNKQGVAEGGFKNKTAVFSGYSNYMRSRAPNVFKQLDIKVLNKEYFEDEDIIEYTVISDGDSLAKARATLETNPQFGGMVLKKGVTEGKEQQWTVTVGTKTGGTSHTMTFTGTKEQAIKKAVARFGTSKNPAVKAVPAKQGVAEGLDADQKKAKQVPSTEMPKKTSPVLGKASKQHPFKGRAVGGGL